MQTSTPSEAPDASTRRTEISSHFSDLASVYHEKNYENPVERGQYPDILIRHEWFLKLLASERGRSLDLGCGSGRLMADLKERSFRVFGSDYSPSMLEATRAMFRSRFPGVQPPLARLDAEQLAFQAGAFDVVTAAGLMEYLSGDDRVLPEIHRILRQNGVLIASARNATNLARPLVLIRDLLRPLPVVGPLLRWLHKPLRRLTPQMPVVQPFSVRRHAPGQYRKLLEVHGFEVEDFIFYRFDVFPPVLRKLFPRRWVTWCVKLERFARSPGGYCATGFIIKARKR